MSQLDVALIKGWLIFFEKTGCVYQKRDVDSWWEQFPHQGQETLESLHIFLGGYAFKKESAGMKLNEARNPLAPYGTQYKGKSGEMNRTKQQSCIEFSNEQNASLIDWVQRELVNGAKDAHQRLCLISGVGPKIASYFMRDVACRFECFPSNGSERHLLQPIDIWVRRVAEALGAQKAPSDHLPAANFIVEQSLKAGILPERVNQGIWYFAAEIA
jgi:hypothetical protein